MVTTSGTKSTALFNMARLWSRLTNILRGGRSLPNGRGLAFVSDADDGPMRSAKEGATIRNADGGPPWIVVDHSVESVIVTKWPGRLWKVEILEAAREQPHAGVNYTRAVSVRVIEETAVSELFGPYGSRVCTVIERARALTTDDLSVLGANGHPLARAAYSRGWRKWLGRGEPDSGDSSEDYADTLAIPGGARSPIHSGFTVLHSVLAERARALVGDAAFVVDEEGNRSFTPPWAAAADPFLHAAMAFGAPELLSPADREALTQAWVERYGEEA
jgi:hypothetical protein